MKKLVLPVIILLVICFGCASMGINLNTPEKKYLAAREELNLLLEEYIKVQNGVSNADHEAAKTAFKAADMALDSWGSRLGETDYNYMADMKLWLEAKSVVLEIIGGL